MRSVTDSLRRERIAREARLTPGERIDLALKLGDADARLLATMKGIDLAAARRLIERSRQHGRRHSGCMQGVAA